ncbi:alpha/beta fold hydrolase [Virgibacillus oceani]|uniref:Alpha/beta hydrolase n=1 Tax=Virgibacillus oceani TaxID=1479511 RepID=A0A917H9X8_9BACI|nr:alpha/beta hydrolase [Virgibacillus oceani]GGG72216.1 alpha/beta hydrolase [Virgibacillus oceani]
MNKVISKDGTRIVYEKIGTGLPVILVDGAMCYRASGPMRPLASLLSKWFTVYTYDRRGRGESSDTQPYKIKREIEDLEALIGEAGDTAFVYGISSGAVLALKAAGALGSKIQKLALYEPPFTFGEDARVASESYTNSLNELLSAGRNGDAVELFMKNVGIPEKVIVGMRQSPMWSQSEALAPTLAYDDAIMGDGTVPIDDAKAVAIPALVLDGGSSPLFMHEAADSLNESMPSARRYTVKEQTHDVDPEVLAPILQEFFKED